METSDQGKDFIKTREGFEANAYPDVAGLGTIGYGHKIKPGEVFGTISEKQACDLLNNDVGFCEHAIEHCVTVDLEQNQYDALVSFIYNAGISAFAQSHLLAHINNREFEAAAAEFIKWDHIHVNGELVESQGLKSRRELETNLFTNGDYAC